MNYGEKIKSAFEYAISSNYDKYDIQINARKRFAEAETVVFFGTGEFFQDCCNYGYINFDFDYVCDNDSSKWGKLFYGKKCISPDELEGMKGKAVVLIVIGNYKPVQEQLNKIGIENYNLNDIFCNMYDKKYSADWFKSNLSKAIETLDLFNDEKSKEVYTVAILNRIAPNLSDKEFNDIREIEKGQYYNHGIFGFGKDEVMIDAGAFDGDSALEFIEAVNGDFEKIYAFELQEDKYNKMLKCLDRYKDKIEFINKGVWNKSELLNFGNLKNGAYLTQTESENKTNVISIDEVVKNNKVTFIKMDIEGSEIPALDGSKNVIKIHKPKLAISAYHYLSDLWNIPQKIKEICPEYKIYLRHYTPIVWDTNCYAYV